MIQPFLITGLPRSKTAWLANLLTWGSTFCAHDGLRPEMSRHFEFKESVACLVSKLRTGEWNGHSDAANVLAWQELEVEFPHAKWLVVKRPLNEVLDSCRKIIPSVAPAGIGALNKKLEELIYQLNPKIVEFDEISPTTCYDIANYFQVNIGPHKRVNQLCEMNIQIHPPILMQRLDDLIHKQ